MCLWCDGRLVGKLLGHTTKHGRTDQKDSTGIAFHLGGIKYASGHRRRNFCSQLLFSRDVATTTGTYLDVGKLLCRYMQAGRQADSTEQYTIRVSTKAGMSVSRATRNVESNWNF